MRHPVGHLWGWDDVRVSDHSARPATTATPHPVRSPHPRAATSGPPADDVPADLDDERGDDQDEDRPDETAPPRDGGASPDVATEEVGRRHNQTDLDQNQAHRREDRQRAEV